MVLGARPLLDTMRYLGYLRWKSTQVGGDRMSCKPLLYINREKALRQPKRVQQGQIESGAKKQKKGKQINVKMDQQLYEQLQTACALHEHAEGQLVRILVKWALPFYLRAGGVTGLKRYGETMGKAGTNTA